MKNIATLFIVLLCLAFAGTGAQAQVFNWATSISNLPTSFSGELKVKATAIDTAGNIYGGATTLGAIQHGGQIFPAGDSITGIVVSKFFSSGNLHWLKRFGSTDDYSSELADLTLDAAGNVYVLGWFRNNIVIDTIAYTTNSQSDYFLVKLSPAGVVQWFKQGGGSGYKNPESLTIDQAGNILVTGTFSFPSTFGSITLTGPASDNVFCMKMDSGGNILWANTISSGSAFTHGAKIRTDTAGNIMVAGAYRFGSFTWNGQTAPTTISFRLFWVKMNQTGQVQLMRTLPMINSGGFNQLDPILLEVDALGYSYLGNSFNTTINLGGIIFNGTGSRNTYLTRYDPNGVLQWAKKITASAQSQAVGQSLALDGQGKIYMAGRFNGTMTIDTTNLSSLNSLPAFVASFDQYIGAHNWVVRADAQEYAQGNALSASPAGKLALAGNFMNGPVTLGSLTTGATAPLLLQSMYISSLVQDYNIMAGSVFVDTNGNGVQDATETGLAGGNMMQVNSGPVAYHTGANGNYAAVAGLGIATVTVQNPPLYYNVTSSGLGADFFNTYGNVSYGHNFALQPVPNQTDLRVLITPMQPARPGFTTSYRLTFQNLGTVTIPAGSVTLTYDPLLSFLSTTQPNTQAGNVLTWAYAALEPGQVRNINVVFSVPTSAVIGYSLSATAAINTPAGELTPADNTDTSTRLITASFDPNKIVVNYDEITTQQVQSGQWLSYTIHFQNLGTDTAFTVLVRDTLPTQLLKTGTIEFLAASHNCSWWVSSSNILNMQFTNIKLPHQSINVVGSNGFAKFRIRPQAGLAVGDIIPNRAQIYFDYNPYIVTNTAQTEVVHPTAAGDILPQHNWQLYPNPTTEYVTVRAILNQFGEVNLRLLNALGQEVLSRNFTAETSSFQQELNLETLPTGIYSVQLKTPEGSAVKRLVKQ